MLRPYNALLDNNTRINSNKPFRQRMIELIREGKTDAISVWNINTLDQLTAHDKLCQELKAEQQTRQVNKPSMWQVRRSAEQSQRPSLHHFAAISDSGTWCNQPSNNGSNPVVPFPLPLQSQPLGALSHSNLSPLAPSNTFLASSHNIHASSNQPSASATLPLQNTSHPAKSDSGPSGASQERTHNPAAFGASQGRTNHPAASGGPWRQPTTSRNAKQGQNQRRKRQRDARKHNQNN
jgi:hypothetical protein